MTKKESDEYAYFHSRCLILTRNNCIVDFETATIRAKQPKHFQVQHNGEWVNCRRVGPETYQLELETYPKVVDPIGW